MRKSALFILGVMTMVAQGANAQAPPSATAPPLPTATSEVAVNCAPTTSERARGTVAPETTTGQARQPSEPLSDKLAKSDGVLCPPPGIDPEIHAPTPDAGNMPVIPPPGSPGGNPDVRPK
jgi:hypothetical protein